ncbi:N-6 DNA methylase [Maribacter flavus]|uniref:site-specific DNA-methyltransferase (adenine-specific) n=1 Tax=Maribacter flavus TaxID=1658664 RepID=A0A5B2TVV4_9FLAO|nr:N-6 DNA methylase [Maribacter flavus]KAA2218253.1 N-6 DNA methylase [Maribacter flavus]
MVKTREVPRELKNFNSLFNSLIYRHDVSTIFDDFLTVFICCFARGTQEPLYFETIKRYNRKELDLFAKMMGELIILYAKAKNDDDWIDPLGDYYEVLAGQYKKSRLGQFFTPKPLCDLMAEISLTGSSWGKTVNDCACGSGRMLLSSNKVVQGNYYVAQDLDPICCKMSAINLCMHGIRAEVHQMDTLRMTKPHRSYLINPKFHEHKTHLILIK